jgi:hypothetical protein
MSYIETKIVGGLNFGDSNKKLLKSKKLAKSLVKSFTLRHNIDKQSEEDWNELSEILKESSAKVEKFVQRPS